MMFFGLLVLAGFVLLFVWLVRSASGGAGGGRGYGRHDPSVDIARERYARGEITSEELERIERDLRR
ncbi:MAG: SHOCT domain-containing protein [Coriobacteriia bacterium]|nr:SHOCT domain-containing protein [Coriobacteriia bacterium]